MEISERYTMALSWNDTSMMLLVGGLLKKVNAKFL